MATRTDVPHTPDQVKEIWDKLVSEAPNTSFNGSRKEQTVLQILENDSRASIFLKRLKKYSGLFETLKNTETEHTVFVPVDKGWPDKKGRLPIGNLLGGWSRVDEEVTQGSQEVQFIQKPLDEEDTSIEEATLSMHVSPHYLSVEDLISMPNIPTVRQCLVSQQTSSTQHQRRRLGLHCQWHINFEGRHQGQQWNHSFHSSAFLASNATGRNSGQETRHRNGRPCISKN